MKYLLDTHIVLWFIEGNENLPIKTKDVIENFHNQCFVSVASFWEMAIKISLGKLLLNGDLDVFIKKVLDNNINILGITTDHLKHLTTLTFTHKDPFDRLLIAQSVEENLTIITKDSYLSFYQNVKIFS